MAWQVSVDDQRAALGQTDAPPGSWQPASVWEWNGRPRSSRKEVRMATRQRKGATAAVAERTEQPEKRRRGPRAGTENARRGGMAVREKYGHEYFARIGAKGGKTVRERRGSEFYANIGRLGGQTTRDTLGADHYERIGRMGGLRTRKRERERTTQTE